MAGNLPGEGLGERQEVGVKETRVPVGLCSCWCGQQGWGATVLLPGISIAQVRARCTLGLSSRTLHGGSTTRERETLGDLSPASSDRHLCDSWVPFLPGGRWGRSREAGDGQHQTRASRWAGREAATTLSSASSSGVPAVGPSVHGVQ